MIIENPQYITDGIDTDINVGIKATINGVEMSVPLDTANRHYAEILKQVADGDITIADVPAWVQEEADKVELQQEFPK